MWSRTLYTKQHGAESISTVVTPRWHDKRERAMAPSGSPAGAAAGVGLGAACGHVAPKGGSGMQYAQKGTCTWLLGDAPAAMVHHPAEKHMYSAPAHRARLDGGRWYEHASHLLRQILLSWWR